MLVLADISCSSRLGWCIAVDHFPGKLASEDSSGDDHYLLSQQSKPVNPPPRILKFLHNLKHVRPLPILTAPFKDIRLFCVAIHGL